jgi:hypothetical protein
MVRDILEYRSIEENDRRNTGMWAKQMKGAMMKMKKIIGDLR